MSTDKPASALKVKEVDEEIGSGEGQTKMGDYTVRQFFFSLH
jgi:hypothetical protein